MMDEEFRKFWGRQRTIHWCPLLHVALSTGLDEPRILCPLTGGEEVSPSVKAVSRKIPRPADSETKCPPQK